MHFTPFIRQLYVVLSPFLATVSLGGAVAYPTVLLRQLKANDSSIQIDFDTASWMGSIHGLAGIPSILMPILIQWKGKKFSIIFNCIVMIIGWTLAYFATNAATILVSEALHGFGTNSLLCVNCLIITEMTSPKYRNTFIQILYVIQSMSMALDGLFVQYFHWKIISVIMLVPMAISVILACTIPESPYWLAYKGQLSKCEKNFTWLRGSDVDSKKELYELTHKVTDKTNSFSIPSAKYFCKNVISRDFLLPASHICILQILVYGSGSIVTLIYAIEMMEKTSNSDGISSFGGFIFNSLCCFGVCISIVFDRVFNTKSVLLWGTVCTSVCLIVTSVLSYLQCVGLWHKESLLGVYCLIGFVLSSSIGIIGTVYPIVAVLIPVQYRGLGGALVVINTCLFHAITLKSAPYMFLYLNMWGTYLVYSTMSISCGLLIWKYVPETKGRSLQEIDNFYHFNSYSQVNNNVINTEDTSFTILSHMA